MRTVAYDSLSRRDRKERHVAVAAYLAAEPDAETITAVIASHYLDAYAAAGPDEDAAALGSRAVELLEQAAAQARGVPDRWMGAASQDQACSDGEAVCLQRRLLEPGASRHDRRDPCGIHSLRLRWLRRCGFARQISRFS